MGFDLIQNAAQLRVTGSLCNTVELLKIVLPNRILSQLIKGKECFIFKAEQGNG